MKYILATLIFFMLPLATLAHDAGVEATGVSPPPSGEIAMTLPDVAVTDQDNTRRGLLSGLAGHKTVVLNFIFTACTTSCPVATAKLRTVQDKVRGDPDIVFISVTVDPDNDTPDSLKSYAGRFGVLPGWYFVRAERPALAELLRAAGVRPGVAAAHIDQVYVGSPATGKWDRIDAAASPDVILRAISRNKSASLDAAAESSAYFTNLPLLDQNGATRHFYNDVLRGRKVLIMTAYTTCKDACPVMTERVRAAVERLPASLRQSFHVIVISSDAATDTPDRLRAFADEHGVQGWQFLTGKKENVDWVLYKLGLYGDDPAGHSTGLLVGDVARRHWMKTLSLADPEQLARAIETFESTDIADGQ